MPLNENKSRGIFEPRTTEIESKDEPTLQVFEIIPWALSLDRTLRRVEALVPYEPARHYMPVEYFIEIGTAQNALPLDMGALTDEFFDVLCQETACDLVQSLIGLSYLRVQKRHMVHCLYTADNSIPIAHAVILESGIVYGAAHNRNGEKGFGFVVHTGKEGVFQPFSRQK